MPECPTTFFFPGRKDTQVPECPSARLEMLDLKVGVPEGPSARPLFFFLEGMEMVGLRGGVPITAQIPECQTLSFPGGTI